MVDDEPQIVRGLKVILRTDGYEVETAATPGGGERRARRAARPTSSCSISSCPTAAASRSAAALRSWSRVPVVVLSAVGDEREKVRALDAGADDYVTKPFNAEELLARLRAVLRRTTDDAGAPLVEIGEITIDLADRRVTRGGAEVHLTPREFELLRTLARHRGRLVTHRQLLQEVWGPGYGTETHYLRVHVAHIRAKLEADPQRPRHLLTEPGVGYRLQSPDERPR